MRGVAKFPAALAQGECPICSLGRRVSKPEKKNSCACWKQRPSPRHFVCWKCRLSVLLALSFRTLHTDLWHRALQHRPVLVRTSLGGQLWTAIEVLRTVTWGAKRPARPEGPGDKFLRNVGPFSNVTARQAWRPNSSCPQWVTRDYVLDKMAFFRQ